MKLALFLRMRMRHFGEPRHPKDCLSNPISLPSRTETVTWELLAAKASYCPQSLATLCNVSIATLERHFKRNYKLKVGTWLRSLVLDKAYQRIISGEQIEMVATELGYKHIADFSDQFKQAHGIVPELLSKGWEVPPLRKIKATLKMANRRPRRN